MDIPEPKLGSAGFGIGIWGLGFANPKHESQVWDIVVGICEAWDMLSISQAQGTALGYARFGI